MKNWGKEGFVRAMRDRVRADLIKLCIKYHLSDLERMKKVASGCLTENQNGTTGQEDCFDQTHALNGIPFELSEP